MGKTPEDLEASRKKREFVIQQFGEVPTSVWNINYSKSKDDTILLESRGQNQVGEEKHKKMKYNLKTFENQSGETTEFNQMTKDFKMSSLNVRGKSSGLSTFPVDLCRKIVAFYSEEGDTILDPCAGRASRLPTVHKMNRNYIGYDVCHEFMEVNREIAKELTDNQLFKSPYTITLHEQTSEKMVESDESVDLVMTSPPYWDVEFYDDNPAQLGYKHTYLEFLEGIRRIMQESYRVLKPGKFCVFNVNDFRKEGDFYMYHADTARIMEEVGLKLCDIIIIPWSSCVGAAFADQVWQRKITAKKHEYLIVSRKI